MVLDDDPDIDEAGTAGETHRPEIEPKAVEQSNSSGGLQTPFDSFSAANTLHQVPAAPRQQARSTSQVSNEEASLATAQAHQRLQSATSSRQPRASEQVTVKEVSRQTLTPDRTTAQVLVSSNPTPPRWLPRKDTSASAPNSVQKISQTQQEATSDGSPRKRKLPGASVPESPTKRSRHDDLYPSKTSDREKISELIAEDGIRDQARKEWEEARGRTDQLPGSDLEAQRRTSKQAVAQRRAAAEAGERARKEQMRRELEVAERIEAVEAHRAKEEARLERLQSKPNLQVQKAQRTSRSAVDQPISGDRGSSRGTSDDESPSSSNEHGRKLPDEPNKDMTLRGTPKSALRETNTTDSARQTLRAPPFDVSAKDLQQSSNRSPALTGKPAIIKAATPKNVSFTPVRPSTSTQRPESSTRRDSNSTSSTTGLHRRPARKVAPEHSSTTPVSSSLAPRTPGISGGDPGSAASNFTGTKSSKLASLKSAKALKQPGIAQALKGKAKAKGAKNAYSVASSDSDVEILETAPRTPAPEALRKASLSLSSNKAMKPSLLVKKFNEEHGVATRASPAAASPRNVLTTPKIASSRNSGDTTSNRGHSVAAAGSPAPASVNTVGPRALKNLEKQNHLVRPQNSSSDSQSAIEKRAGEDSESTSESSDDAASHRKPQPTASKKAPNAPSAIGKPRASSSRKEQPSSSKTHKPQVSSAYASQDVAGTQSSRLPFPSSQIPSSPPVLRPAITAIASKSGKTSNQATKPNGRALEEGSDLSSGSSDIDSDEEELRARLAASMKAPLVNRDMGMSNEGATAAKVPPKLVSDMSDDSSSGSDDDDESISIHSDDRLTEKQKAEVEKAPPHKQKQKANGYISRLTSYFQLPGYGTDWKDNILNPDE